MSCGDGTYQVVDPGRSLWADIRNPIPQINFAPAFN